MAGTPTGETLISAFGPTHCCFLRFLLAGNNPLMKATIQGWLGAKTQASPTSRPDRRDRVRSELDLNILAGSSVKPRTPPGT